ncbi:MAG: archease [Caldisphaera sp.]|jgi:SHS2 domain-containing protein|nr:archease [Caldisphaera sp.]PMP90383.1 MAG: archease [Caldisphaera sp.]
MEKCSGFEFLDHTSDVLIRAYGRNLEESFEQSALAVYEVMTDTKKVKQIESRYIEIEGFDLYNLLYRWIESLLFYTDSEGLVFSKFNVEKINENKLKAVAMGEKFNKEIHEHRTIVKAMTYSQMDIKFSNNCWIIDFVVDI